MNTLYILSHWISMLPLCVLLVTVWRSCFPFLLTQPKTSDRDTTLLVPPCFRKKHVLLWFQVVLFCPRVSSAENLLLKKWAAGLRANKWLSAVPGPGGALCSRGSPVQLWGASLFVNLPSCVSWVIGRHSAHLTAGGVVSNWRPRWPTGQNATCPPGQGWGCGGKNPGSWLPSFLWLCEGATSSRITQEVLGCKQRVWNREAVIMESLILTYSLYRFSDF